LKAKIKSYAHGELPHAEHILPALYELIENYGSTIKVMPFPEAVESPDQEVINGNWEGLKWALASSLTSGTFLDSQFYAVESRSSTGLPKIRPLYFCSTVGGGFTSKLVACKSLPWIMCGWAVNSSFQILRNSEHGENHLLDVQMVMTATLTTRILTQRAPRSVTLVQSCSLIRS